MSTNKRNLALKNSGKFVPNFKIEGTKLQNEYFISKFNIPNINSEGQTINSPAGKLPIAGEVAEFGEITLTIVCDEELNVWKDMFNLFNNMQKFGTSKNAFNDDNYQPSIIEVYNQKSKHIFSIILHNCVIRSLSALDYDASSSENITFDIVLQVSHLDII